MTTFFKTEEELKGYLPLTAGFKLSQLQPILLRVVQRRLREALGLAQLTALATAYDAGTLGAAGQALLDAVRAPLASYAAARFVAGGAVQLGATGAVASESANLKPASAGARADLVQAAAEDGACDLDALLEFLEDNRASYPLWAESAACTIAAGQVLATAREFERFVRLPEGDARRRFQQLQPVLRDVEHLAVQPITGRPLLAQVRAQLAAGTLTVRNTELLSYVRPAVANLAMQDDEHRQATGSAYLDELRAFLYDRADDYPLFKESPAYQPDVAVQLQQDPAWGFVAML